MDAKYAVILGGILALTIGAYLPIRSAPWVYEDAHIQVVGPGPALTLPSRTLTTWSLLATGGSAGRAHSVTLALHLAVGLLVATLAFHLAGPIAMVVAAGVQLWHPLNSQAVWYATGRSDVLMTLAVLVAVLAAVCVTGWWRWPVVVLGVIAASGSKEIGVVAVPLVLLSLLAWRRDALQAPMTGLFWIATGAVIGSSWRPALAWITLPGGVGGPDVAWGEFVVRQLGLMWALLLTLVIPRGFAIDHDALALSGAWLFGSVLMTGVAGVFAVWAWRRAPVEGWAVAFAGVAILPRLIVPTNEFLSERHLYLSMVGVAVLVGRVAARWVAQPSGLLTWWRTAGNRTGPVVATGSR